ncbi:CsbD family protein [uncultured Arcanobacterium sp.]|uniref:CsbD family protein n=1 Tax=uncultured Arcanobacterium sp. TaxID=487520 RepID=UPI0026329395|nr:CsbD family protein [uncultured Arcanobacterium sp.]
MSTLENKFDEAAGKAKEVAGEVANDKDMKAEGKIQNTEAKVKETAENIGKKAKDTAEDIEAGAKKLAERAKNALHGKGKN